MAGNLPINTNTTKYPTVSFLQATLPLSTNTIKDDLFLLGGNISELNNLNKWMGALEIVQR